MKKSLLVLILFSFALSFMSFGQEDKKLSREDRRELQKQKRAEMDSIYAIEIAKALNIKRWVLQANQLSNTVGETVNVNSNLNFIAIHGDSAYIQLGRETGMGTNGVGGVTVLCNISQYKVTKDKKNTYYIYILARNPAWNFTITINMNSTGQMATATVQAETARTITYTGQVVPSSQSTIYKGTPLF